MHHLKAQLNQRNKLIDDLRQENRELKKLYETPPQKIPGEVRGVRELGKCTYKVGETLEQCYDQSPYSISLARRLSGSSLLSKDRDCSESDRQCKYPTETEKFVD